VVGSCEHDNESVGSIKIGEYFDKLSDLRRTLLHGVGCFVYGN